jgi:hypothetical protein
MLRRWSSHSRRFLIASSLRLLEATAAVLAFEDGHTRRVASCGSVRASTKHRQEQCLRLAPSQANGSQGQGTYQPNMVPYANESKRRNVIPEYQLNGDRFCLH